MLVNKVNSCRTSRMSIVLNKNSSPSKGPLNAYTHIHSLQYKKSFHQSRLPTQPYPLTRPFSSTSTSSQSLSLSSSSSFPSCLIFSSSQRFSSVIGKRRMGMGRNWKRRYYGTGIGSGTVPGAPVVGSVTVESLPGKVGWRVEREKWGYVQELEAMSRATGTHSRFFWHEPPKTVLLILKPNDQRATNSSKAIATFIQKEFPNLRILIEPSAKSALPVLEEYTSEPKADGSPGKYLGDVIDFVIAVGGDGTILHVSSLFEKEVPPILSFSMGTLGFLMPFRIDDYKDAIRLVMKGGFFFTPRERLTCRVERKFQVANQPKIFQVMNEIALHRGAAVQIADIDVYINEAFLTNAKGDGLIVATATGSTAYSLSCGGSMVHPSIQAILVTPICPRSLSFRPALLPKDVIVKLKVSETSRSAATVSFDGLQTLHLNRGEFIAVFTSPYYLPTINRRDETSDWLRDINDLLAWNRKFG